MAFVMFHDGFLPIQAIEKVFLSTIRAVLEYAIPIWQSIPDYLSDRVESIYTKESSEDNISEAESYDQSLRVAKLETLASRRIYHYVPSI